MSAMLVISAGLLRRMTEGAATSRKARGGVTNRAATRRVWAKLQAEWNGTIPDAGTSIVSLEVDGTTVPVTVKIDEGREPGERIVTLTTSD